MRRAFIAALAAALSAVTCGVLVAVAAAVFGRLEWAAEAGLIAAGVGAAVLAAALVQLFWWRRFSRIASVVAASAAAASVIGAMGFRDVTAMAAGVEVSCAAGLGSCQATGQAKMPLLLDAGPVQAHPVIRLIVWGATGAERAVVNDEEKVAPSLGQPLLEDYYGVHPATDGGSWAAPGDPRTWLRRHHQAALFPSDLKNLIDQARAAEHWPDTADTQYWLATDLTAAQIGIGPGACADHVQLGALKGAVVRLPFGSCTLPASRDDITPGASCRPLAVVGPGVNTPKTIEAGIDIFMDHEYAEAATDPQRGWTLLVDSRCHGDPLLEIADVCEPDGSFISAPAWRTAAGWQPSLFEPAGPGHPARCVNPARPDPPGRR